jgi:hypothetical protein
LVAPLWHRFYGQSVDHTEPVGGLFREEIIESFDSDELICGRDSKFAIKGYNLKGGIFEIKFKGEIS